MKFDTILEYQRVDLELIALETEATSSKERAALLAAKKNLDTATSTVGKLSAEAGEIIANYGKIQDKMNDLKTKLDEFTGLLEDLDDVKEAEYYLKEVDAIVSEIIALEKEANKEMNRIDGVNNDYKKTWEAGTKASEVFRQAKAVYDKFMAELQPKANEIKAKLDALVKEIPEDLMDRYKALRDPKKMPVFVEYDASKKICGRCRMEMPNDVIEKLRQSGDYAECPNCRRINFLP